VIATPAREDTGSVGGNAAATRAVFVSDFVHVGASFSDLAPVFMDEGAAWLRRLESATPDPAGDGSDAGPGAADGIATAVVRLGIGAMHAGPAVTVSAGPPRFRDHNVIVPITWEPLALEQLLPRLDGDLELSDFGSDVARLALSGRYRVPLGSLGWGIDRIAMHRVAEASLRRFLQDVQQAVLDGR
jgi:hypothetical protein